ncbi:hypothetical protein BJ742DRAFT_785991 [Cladochytrium replicatum]|nr:hypothetical protein BJ742DRAFT_785991 [Cladochytrium replicatum]
MECFDNEYPEIFWSERAAVFCNLQIPRNFTSVETLNQRVNVITGLLHMLKDHQTSSHGELLEWIVIILILFETLSV